MPPTTKKAAPEETTHELLPGPMRVGMCFAAQRLRAYCDYIEEAATITNPADFARLNMSYLDSMREAYLSEATLAFRTVRMMSPLMTSLTGGPGPAPAPER